MPLKQLWPFKSASSTNRDRRRSSPREREEWALNTQYETDKQERDELDRKLRLLAAEAAVFARKEFP